MNRWMLQQHGVWEFRTEGLLHLHQHASSEQGVTTQGEEILVKPDSAELQKALPDFPELRFDGIGGAWTQLRVDVRNPKTHRVQSLHFDLAVLGGGKRA